MNARSLVFPCLASAFVFVSVAAAQTSPPSGESAAPSQAQQSSKSQNQQAASPQNNSKADGRSQYEQSGAPNAGVTNSR